MKLRILSIAAAGVFLLSLAACHHAEAATLSAGPADLVAVLKTAKGGDKVVLKDGHYRNLTIQGVTFSPPVTVDASAAVIERLVLKDVGGLTFTGGRWVPGCTSVPCANYALRAYRGGRLKVQDAGFYGPADVTPGAMAVQADGYGARFENAVQTEVTGSIFYGFKVGLVFHMARDLVASGNRFSGMRSDGINVSQSWGGLIERNVFDGTRITSDEHPDAIQAWSRPDAAPTSDLVIRGNRAAGDMQGIGMFNHVRDGIDDGGFDRITIEDNDFLLAYPAGISIESGRDSLVRNNRVATMPGARWIAKMSIGPGVRSCGNVVEPGAGKKGVTEPKCLETTPAVGP